MKTQRFFVCGICAVTLVLAFAACKQSVTPDPAPVTLSSITADYSSTNLIFPDTTLHTLKEDLTVTAHYSDGTSKKLVTEEYDLVGPLAAGSCTITVKYQSKETTFTVMVGALHDHVWGAWVPSKAPTCTATGENIRTCTASSPTHDESEVIPIDPNAHDWGDWIVTTTVSVTDDGIETQTCRNDSTHHGSTRLYAYATGTIGLAFELITSGVNNGTYRVRKGSVTDGEVHIPAYHRPAGSTNFDDYKPVTEIGSSSDTNATNNPTSAFGGSSTTATRITTVYIPATVTSIGAYAFNYCPNLTSITIPASVTSIGAYAFFYCTSLTSITIPVTVTSIGNRAFSRSNLTTVTFAEGIYIEKINDYMFEGCAYLTTVTIPATVTAIGDFAFEGCRSLTGLTIPEGVTSIGERAFFTCDSISSITIPASVTVVGPNALSWWISRQTINVPFANAGARPAGWNANWYQYSQATVRYWNGTSYQ